MKDYETVIVLNPALSASQAEDAVKKFTDILNRAKSDIVNVEHWGLRQMAYPIQKKTTGFYNLVEFRADPTSIKTFETELTRDESVMRFLTVSLDKHALEYNIQRRNGKFEKKKQKDDKPTKDKAAA